MGQTTAKSSAKKNGFAASELRLSQRSLMYKLNSIGEITDPYGTPMLVG